MICTGITEYTSDLINRAIAKAGPGSTIKQVKKAEWVNRNLNNIPHQATKIVLEDGTEKGSAVVFDWHATMSVSNPLIYPSTEDFREGTTSFTYDRFIKFVDLTAHCTPEDPFGDHAGP